MRGLLAAACLAAFTPSPAAALTPDRKYYYEDIYAPFFVRDPADPGLYRSARPGANPSSFTAVKPSNGFRVFLIGGSTTGGYAGARDLGQTLSLLLPGRKVEVLNCGMAGYESSREWLVEREILNYSPDLIVFLGGHNEFFIRNAGPIPLWLLRLQDYFDRWAWYRSLRRGLSRGDMTMADNQTRLGEFERTYRHNLREALKRGVKVVACSPPLNYKDNPPLDDPPWASAAFMTGWTRYLAGDAGAAAAVWKRGLDSGEPADVSARPYLFFYLGQAAARLGRGDEALDYFELSLESPRIQHVCARSCRAAIKESAAQEGALWADLDGAFRRFDRPRLPGLDMFGDEIHWSGRFHGLVSLAVVEAMRSDAALKSLPWDERGLAEISKRWPAQAAVPGVADQQAELEHVLFYTVQGLSFKNGFSWQAASWLEFLAERAPGVVRDAGAVERAMTAAAARTHRKVWQADATLTLRRASLLWHLAEMRLRRGQPGAAVPLLEEALRLDPSQKLVLVDLALAQALSGKRDEARRTLRGAAVPEAAVAARALGF